MRKKLFYLLSVVLSIIFLCTISVYAQGILAFDVPEYSVFINKNVKAKVVAQNIDSKLSYEWSSSDEKIAIVDKTGNIKGISEGSATITCKAKTEKDEVFEAKCNVKVTIPISSIKVEKKQITLAPYDAFGASTNFNDSNIKSEDGAIPMVFINGNKAYYAYKPIVKIQPENATMKDIEWKSSDFGVSVTDNGVVYSTGYPGTYTITGVAKDGSGAKVSYKVKVPKGYATSNKIVIENDEGVDWGYTYASSNGINMYSMYTTGDCFSLESTNNKNILGMDMSKIVPVKPGKGKIIVTHNYRKIVSTTVEVKKSAVRSEKNYPALKFSDISSKKDSYIGKNVQISGNKISYEKKKVSDFIYNKVKEDNEYSGVVLAYSEDKDGERHYYKFEYNYGKSIKDGENTTIFGTIDHFENYTTETGLNYEIPYLVNVTLK